MKKLIPLSIALLSILMNRNSNAQTEVTFYTSMGDFVVEMYDTITPITSGNFVKLVNDKYYDGVIFHRIIDKFMIQGGDPTGTGTGGPGYSIDDEFDSSLSNIRQTISMANSGPNSGGSQFFINLVNNTRLDFNKPPASSQHAVFGIVIDNFSVVQTIGKVPTNGSDRPLTDVVMDSLRVTKEYFVGIPDPTKEISSLHIYPNPVTEESVVLLNAKKPTAATVMVHDQLGRVVRTFNVNLVSGKNQLNLVELQFDRLTQGVYFLSIHSGQSSIQQKIVVIQ